ncbi:MAG: hypothetical protein AABX49_02635 [Nanoarchaeota archaeon]
MNKKGELAKQILLASATGLAIVTALLLPGSAAMFAPLAKRFKTKKHSFIKSLKALKRDRLVDFREEGSLSKIKITEKGREKVLRYNLDNLEIKKPKKWDKIWRIVTFDIPEDIRPARDALRAKLKELGFYRLNKSVFVFPYPCLDEIQFIEEIFKIGPYINFIEARTIEDDDWLKSRFRLPK